MHRPIVLLTGALAACASESSLPDAADPVPDAGATPPDASATPDAGHPTRVDALPYRCPGRATDCDGDGIPDARELAEGRALDCNLSGVPDACEVIEDACRTANASDDVEYFAGDLPIVLSVPHGGASSPDEIPDRPDALGTDVRTLELGQQIADAFERATGRRPHLVQVNLHRSKLDANRDLPEAANGHPRAARAWRDFHRYIEAAKEAVEHQHGRGLYVDLHGLAASRTHIELGYGLGGRDLLEPDERLLQHDAYAFRSSVRHVAGRWTLPYILRGSNSLGSRLSEAGYPTIPSATSPDPGVDPEGAPNRFFGGGYNTRRHGSAAGGTIDGVQVETTWAGVRDSPANRRAFAEVLVAELLWQLSAHHRLTPAEPGRVAFGLEQQVAAPGDRLRVPLCRYGDLADPLEVTFEDPDGLATSAARFAAGDREATVELVAPEAPGPYELRLTPRGYSPDETDAFALSVRGPGRDAVWIRDLPERILEGDEAIVHARRAFADAAATLPAPTVEAPGLTFTPDPIPFAAGEREVAVVLAAEEDDRPGHRRLLVVDAARRPRIVIIEDDEPIADLVAWGPDHLLGDLADPDRVWSRLRANEGAIVAPASVAPGRPSPMRVSQQLGAALSDLDYASDAGFTVAFRFSAEPVEAPGFAYLFSHGRLSASASLNVYLTPAGAMRTALRGPGEAADYGALDVPGDLRDDRSHHYALSVAPGPMAAVYLDGARAATAARGNLPFDPATHVFVGGRYDTTDERVLTGTLLDVRIYRRALSADEIRSVAEAAP